MRPCAFQWPVLRRSGEYLWVVGVVRSGPKLRSIEIRLDTPESFEHMHLSNDNGLKRLQQFEVRTSCTFEGLLRIQVSVSSLAHPLNDI